MPESAPPYDDERPAGTSERPAKGRRPQAAGQPGKPAQDKPAQGRPAQQDRPAQGRPPQDRPPQVTGAPGEQAAWPGQFAQVLAETLAGSRPAQQIVPWTTEQARRHIRRLGPQLTAAQRPVVRRVLTSSPATGVVELTAIVGFGPRVRALAIRLERQPSPGQSSPGQSSPGQPSHGQPSHGQPGAGQLGAGQPSSGSTLPLPDRWRCTAIAAA